MIVRSVQAACLRGGWSGGLKLVGAAFVRQFLQVNVSTGFSAGIDSW